MGSGNLGGGRDIRRQWRVVVFRSAAQRSRQSEEGNLHGLVARARMRWGADTQIVDVLVGDLVLVVWRALKGERPNAVGTLLQGRLGKKKGARGRWSTLNRTDEDEGIDGVCDDIDGDIVGGRERERHSTR
jgi:hypothetical protein